MVLGYRRTLYAVTGITVGLLSFNFYRKHSEYPSEIRKPLRYALRMKHRSNKSTEDIENQELALKDALEAAKPFQDQLRPKAYAGLFAEMGAFYAANSNYTKAAETYQDALKAYDLKEQDIKSSDATKYRASLGYLIADSWFNASRYDKAEMWLDWSISQLLLGDPTKLTSSKDFQYSDELWGCFNLYTDLLKKRSRVRDAFMAYYGALTYFMREHAVTGSKLAACRCAFIQNELSSIAYEQKDLNAAKKWVSDAEENVNEGLKFASILLMFHQHVRDFCEECNEAILDNKDFMNTKQGN